LRSHTSRLYEQLSFTEIFSTASHTSRLSEHLSATEMFWTTSTAYIFMWIILFQWIYINIQVNVTQYNTVDVVQMKFSYVYRNVLYVGSACTAICVVYVVQTNIMYVGFHW